MKVFAQVKVDRFSLVCLLNAEGDRCHVRSNKVPMNLAWSMILSLFDDLHKENLVHHIGVIIHARNVNIILFRT